jgi:hypothetical protein
LDSAFGGAAAEAQDAHEGAVDPGLGGSAAEETRGQQWAVDAGFGGYEDAPQWQWAANAAFDQDAGEPQDAQEKGAWKCVVRQRQR